jgi:hypothetical protein
MGHLDHERWRKAWQSLLDSHNLVHKRRNTVKIDVSK